MKEFTQSNINPGNCWQTAIACILEVDPESLPPQVEIEALRRDDKVLAGWGSYHNALNGYLKKHHGLIYSEVQRFQFGSVRPAREVHTLNGPTVRTEQHRAAGNKHINHCVVARNGAMVWDVHPSRAGLIDVDSWGVIGEQLPQTQEQKEREERLMAEDAYRLIFSCLCPACGLNELRRRVAEVA